MAPLDWGIGHTTRCVPLMRHIQARGYRVIFAGNVVQSSYISTCLPGMESVFLEGYNITYSRLNRFAQAGLFVQMPSIASTIRSEHQWLGELASRIPLDGIISDNRYGIHLPSIPSVFITHQLQVLSGFGRTADSWTRNLHYRLMRPFQQVWVPDLPGSPNLAGKMSHPAVLPGNVSYIGWLSQVFSPEFSRDLTASQGPVVILLSGPEPQRSDVSQTLWKQLATLDCEVIFIEGTPSARRPAIVPGNVKWCARMAGDELAAVLAEARIIVCRSGYSTLMDLLALGKQALLIPTTGQTEQRYLARKCAASGYFRVFDPGTKSLASAISDFGSGIPFPAQPEAFSLFQPVLDAWLNSL